MTTAGGHTTYVSSSYTQRHGQVEMMFVPRCDGCDWYGPQFLHREYAALAGDTHAAHETGQLVDDEELVDD